MSIICLIAIGLKESIVKVFWINCSRKEPKNVKFIAWFFVFTNWIVVRGDSAERHKWNVLVISLSSQSLMTVRIPTNQSNHIHNINIVEMIASFSQAQRTKKNGTKIDEKVCFKVLGYNTNGCSVVCLGMPLNQWQIHLFSFCNRIPIVITSVFIDSISFDQ